MLSRGRPQPEMRQRGWIKLLSGLMVGVFLLTSTNLSYGFTSDKRVGPFTASAFVDIDTDNDGLGDTWERNYFGNLDQNGNGDYDNDGYNNLWEYQHGTDPTNPNEPNYYFSARNNALGFLKTMMDRRLDSGKRILYSYIDKDGNTDGFGWTYDNAVSIMAFQKAGEWQRAKEVLDAFIWFQDRDPIGDGRIRRAYWANKPIDNLYVGDCGGWIPNDSEASNQSVGDMAIMMLAALRYHEYIGQEESVYLSFAKKLGDWIYENAKSENGAGGYNMARKDCEMADPTNFDRKSTENNIDAYVAFVKLYESSNDYVYRIYALHAKNFILSMWNENQRMFWTGTLDDGITINGGKDSDVTGRDHNPQDPTSGQPEDSSTWGLLALGETAKYGSGIDWVENNCKVTDMDGFIFGYDFNADQDGIWFEGMSHMALSYQMLGNDTKSDSILDEVMKAQHSPTGGIQCASHNGVTTSFTLWTLNTNLHVAPAAWFIFAVDKYNPFWGQDVTEPIPYEGGYDDNGQYIFEEPHTEPLVVDIRPADDGTARAMVELDGTARDDKGTLSVDDDGVIVKYEWDFDGKGTFDRSSTTSGSVRYWYTEVGTHLAKFRVTNDRGYASTRGVTIKISQADLGATFIPPVASGVSASVISGKTPLTVTFTGTGNTGSGNEGDYIAAYEWDFDGNGEYDSYSTSSGNITYTYTEEGTYQPTFKVTDNDGLTDTSSLAIEVLKNPNGPEAKAGANQTVGPAPLKVNFNATRSSSNITTYEWDFEGDGVYDWMSVSDGTAPYSYGEPGTYEAKLKVTDANGVSSTDTVKIRVKYSAGAPEAVGSASPDNGIIPFDVTFTHSSSEGSITKYEWDFGGDKDYDKSSWSPSNMSYTYSRPGYYLATLRVTGENGLTHRGYLPIVAAGPDQAGAPYSSYIKTPKSGQRIYGNSVTVSVGIIPDNNNQDVRLQYKLTTAGEESWVALGLVASIAYPYRMAIDTTAMLSGDYNLRAPVNQNAKRASETIITVGNANNWDIHESINATGERIKMVKVKTNEDADIELLDGTGCKIKSGTLKVDDILTVRAPSGSGRIVDDNVNTILYHREFTLKSNTSLNRTVSVVIPYDDLNNDGIVDGLNMREEELKLYIYNENTMKWEPLANYTVYPDDNYVSGELSHLSIVGIGTLGGEGGVTSTSSGSSGGGGGGGRSCFIATATFGTPMAREVQSLRYFRDTYLLTNRPGEFIIDMYEKYSPPIARAIKRNEFLKGMIRFYLRPVINLARFVNVFSKGVDGHD